VGKSPQFDTFDLGSPIRTLDLGPSLLDLTSLGMQMNISSPEPRSPQDLIFTSYDIHNHRDHQLISTYNLIDSAPPKNERQLKASVLLCQVMQCEGINLSDPHNCFPFS
jgi:hypothetical protein